MSVLQRLRRWLAGRKQKTRIYHLAAPLEITIRENAGQEVYDSSGHNTSDYLAAGLDHYDRVAYVQGVYDSLSLRQKQITALICLGYTNRQIAFWLGLSEHTVNTYAQHLLVRLNMRNRSDMRVFFSVFDFSSWDPHRWA